MPTSIGRNGRRSHLFHIACVIYGWRLEVCLPNRLAADPGDSRHRRHHRRSFGEISRTLSQIADVIRLGGERMKRGESK